MGRLRRYRQGALTHARRAGGSRFALRYGCQRYRGRKTRPRFLATAHAPLSRGWGGIGGDLGACARPSPFHRSLNRSHRTWRMSANVYGWSRTTDWTVLEGETGRFRASANFGDWENGGAGGIRTLDTLLAYTHFPGERLRPLGHRSACSGRRPSIGRALPGQDERLRAGPEAARLGNRGGYHPARRASIACARAMSLGVTPPSLWVESNMSTLLHTFDQSGW